MMEFNEALVLLKEGKGVKRESEKKTLYITVCGNYIMSKCDHPISGCGAYTPWEPTPSDIQASDWVEVKA